MVLFGTFGFWFRNSPGLHEKKRMLGTRIAKDCRRHRESTKAGSMVNVGKGAYRVGTPEEKIPIHAGIKRHSPAAITSGRGFIPVVSAARGYGFKLAAK